MITLTNVNLKFNKTLIRNGKIHIPDNSITVITGKSGSGKTSLLYLIGLISSNSDYDYIFNENRINLKSDKEVSSIRKSRIGYVFQDNAVIDSLSINENIRYAAKIAGVSITDEDIAAYLKKVKLDIDGRKYPRTLSGGEQQRLAIACAMAKKPDLIIADEPTSALDEENSILIMDIFKDFAKQTQKIVVIASHNPLVSNYADVLYEIHDCKINLISGNEYNKESERRNLLPDSKTLPFSFYIKYALKTMRRARLLKTLMLFLCALSIAFAAGIRGMGDGLIKYQKSILKDLSDRKIFLVNLTTPLQAALNVDENLSIPTDELDKI